MLYSISLAKVIGPSCLIIAIAMITNPSVFRQAIEEFRQGAQKMLLLLAAAGHVILGLVLLTTHAVWQWDWPVLITIIGWLLFLRGLFLLWFPGSIESLTKALHQRPWWPYLTSAILFVVGIVLTYYGVLAN